MHSAFKVTVNELLAADNKQLTKKNRKENFSKMASTQQL